MKIAANEPSRAALYILISVLAMVVALAAGLWLTLQILSGWTLPASFSWAAILVPVGFALALWGFAPGMTSERRRWTLCLNDSTRVVCLLRSPGDPDAIEAQCDYSVCHCRIIPVRIEYLAIRGHAFTDRRYLLQLEGPGLLFALACTNTLDEARRECAKLPEALRTTLIESSDEVHFYGTRRTI